MKRYLWLFLFGVLILAGVTPALAGDVVRYAGTATPTATASATSTPIPSETARSFLTATPSPTLTLTAIIAPTEIPAIIPLILHQPTPVGYGPDEFPYNINPLTGLPVPDPRILERRPMVVKITNYPRSVRPQSGLSRADIVYEYYMERGIPRFIAIFYGQDAEYAGPVRSGRFFDEHIFKMYDGIFVFGSADDRILAYLLELGSHWKNSFVLENQEQRDTPCKEGFAYVLCRDRTVETYNNLYVNTAKLEKYIQIRNTQYRPDLTGMRFAYRTPFDGTAALAIRVRYSLFIYNKWEYDFYTGRYLRFQETVGYDAQTELYAPHMDKLSGEQLATDNLVVLSVPNHWFVKTRTTEIMNIPLYGSGDAVIFRDGFAYQAQWVRPDNDTGVLQLYTLDGEPFPLKPGTTWFQVISPESEVNAEPTGWQFIYATPPVPEDLADNPINTYGENPPYGWFSDEFSPEGQATATQISIEATQDAIYALTPSPTPEN